MGRVREFLDREDVEGGRQFCRNHSQNPFCIIVNTGLDFFSKSSREIENAMNREINDQITRLEKRTIIIGTIANIAVYIGLLGTVIGIVNAFHSISQAGQAGLNLVIQGVAEALLNTAVGLGVAIPAVVFYNSISRRIELYSREMDSAAGELLDMVEAINSK